MTTPSAFLTIDGLSEDPITNPFYYMPITNEVSESQFNLQDQGKVAGKTETGNKLLAKNGKHKKLRKTSSSKKSLHIKKSQENPLVSFIKKKVTRGHRLIKVDVYDVNAYSCLKKSAINDGTDNILSLQYVVEDDYDEIMNLTENLVEKIIKKLSVNETML